MEQSHSLKRYSNKWINPFACIILIFWLPITERRYGKKQLYKLLKKCVYTIQYILHIIKARPLIVKENNPSIIYCQVIRDLNFYGIKINFQCKQKGNWVNLKLWVYEAYEKPVTTLGDPNTNLYNISREIIFSLQYKSTLRFFSWCKYLRATVTLDSSFIL